MKKQYDVELSSAGDGVTYEYVTQSTPILTFSARLLSTSTRSSCLPNVKCKIKSAILKRRCREWQLEASAEFPTAERVWCGKGRCGLVSSCSGLAILGQTSY